MTNDDKALVNDLLDADVITQGYGILVSLETCRKAADRIEALSAENERLREALREMFPMTDNRESYGEKYYRAIRIARAALGEQQ